MLLPTVLSTWVVRIPCDMAKSPGRHVLFLCERVIVGRSPKSFAADPMTGSQYSAAHLLRRPSVVFKSPPTIHRHKARLCIDAPACPARALKIRSLPFGVSVFQFWDIGEWQQTAVKSSPVVICFSSYAYANLCLFFSETGILRGSLRNRRISGRKMHA